MHRKVIVIVASLIAGCALSLHAQQQRVEITFTDKQQDLAQEMRAMTAEFNLLQAMRSKLETDLKRLVDERAEWVKKVEILHPGYRVTVDSQGSFLESIPQPGAPAAKK